MTRHLHQAVEPPRGPWFLSTRAEIDVWAVERWATLSALIESESCGISSGESPGPSEPAQLELAA